MTDVPETTAATFCATLVDEWHRCGVTDAVVAPGSRSTPLALAFAADDRIRLHVHHDERSAAFLALGLALATGRPAPVVTTSGTATVELHPAVVEAHHARVPMICLTADRPPELHHVGAPQTVDQTRLYGHAVRWFVDPGVPDDAARSSWRSLAGRAYAEATGAPAGPVQVNLPFRDPLVGRPGPLPAGRSGDAPWHAHVAPRRVLATDELRALAGRVAGRRGVVVAGATGGGRALDRDAVHALARALGWPVLADPRSGCRTPDGTTVAHPDLLLRHPPFAESHIPQVILQIGEPPASKVVAQWAAASGADLVAVTPDGAWFDPDRRAATVLVVDPDDLCRGLADVVAADADAVDEEWLAGWAAADAAAATAVAATVARHPEATEPGTARDVLAALPDGSRLVVASSMPIRDVEWFGVARAGVQVLANRGANGIDGVVSTAVGVALAPDRAPTVLLIGDVALLHDSNGLLGLASRPLDAPFLVVVVDNDGGGIFSFLPQAAQLPAERFERLFGTPHGVDIPALAAVHGIDAAVVEDAADLPAAVADGVTAAGPSMVVVRTSRRDNVAVHDELNAAVAAALG